ncbi:hypothetical protein [Nonomuraea guangzhouensis]|uniref:Uncharacterized protein n=1 Tax=Nonomuraea guangzhouensis TaxID=1291555 RepID=A0ABW4GEP3_9ACTN|nr:hypothetical protein [Nonomuraea guangzhouensis]
MTESSPSAQTAQRGMFRPVLWVLLLISAVLNIVTSNIGINIFVGIGFGLATMACAAALVVDHYRHRRP